MIGKNLRYYRLLRGLTMAQLASLTDVSQMSISNYEKGKRRPSMDILKKLTLALDIRLVDLLKVTNPNLQFAHGEFRKASSLTQGKQDMIRLFVEDYCTRFFQAANLLPGTVLSSPPLVHQTPFCDNTEINARELRKYLKLPEQGPVGNLIEHLENLGVIVFFLDDEIENFDGMNGLTNGRPYIVLNKGMTVERTRTTLMHEVCHFAFRWPQDLSEKDLERCATEIAAAFLIPGVDVIRELGEKRTHISKDFELVCREYWVAKSLLVMRAGKLDILEKNVVKQFFISRNKTYGKKNEPSYLPASASEEPTLLKQLVFRAVAEDFISAQKGGELLHMSTQAVQEACEPEMVNAADSEL